jgi:hypothetical protein
LAHRQRRDRAAPDLVTVATVADTTAPVPTASSAARSTLAAAIARYTEWSAYVDQARDVGLKNAEAALTARGSELTAAKEALKDAEAQGVSAQSALRRALGQASGPTPDEARRNLDLAQAAFDAALREKSLVEEQIGRLERHDLAVAHAARNAAVGSFLAAAPGVRGLLDELHVVRRRAKTIELALSEIAHVAGALPQYWHAITPQDEQPDPALAAMWRDVIAQLLIDPAAPIPGGDPEEPQPEAEAA